MWKEQGWQVSFLETAEDGSRTVGISGIWGHKMQNWAENPICSRVMKSTPLLTSLNRHLPPRRGMNGRTANEVLESKNEDVPSYNFPLGTGYIHCGSRLCPETLTLQNRKWGEKKIKEKKRSIEKQCSVTQQMQKARSVQPVATVSHSYLHNGFPNVLKWLLHKFTDAVDLPSGYDKVLWLIRLQHQPHGLREDKQSQIQCICKWPLWYMTLYCCILDLEITYTHTPS